MASANKPRIIERVKDARRPGYEYVLGYDGTTYGTWSRLGARFSRCDDSSFATKREASVDFLSRICR